MKFVNQLTAYLRRLITQPIGELNRAQRTLRFAVELSRHGARELGRNHAAQMAAALTYRTIFGLVPMTVLMLLVFRAFGGFEQVGADLQVGIYKYLGLSSISLPGEVSDEGSGLTDDDHDGANQAASGSGESNQDQTNSQLRASVDKIIADLTKKASDVNVGSIGVVGLALLIWAALALLITVEQNFNQIYSCPVGRSWYLRVPVYWAVITLGPVLLFVSLVVAQQLVDMVQRGVDAVGMPVVLSGVASGLSGLAALGASWLLLFLLYVLLPNTRVRLRPALVGSLAGALLWELGKWAFKLYVTKAVSYSTLYGTLGLVPLFLMWLYLTWLIVLFGLEITYTLQAMRGREFEKQAARSDQRRLYDPQWLVPVMVRIGNAFSRGQPINADALAHDLRLPLGAVTEVSQTLHVAGLVHTVEGDDGNPIGLTLARRPEDITVKQLLALGRTVSISGQGQGDDPGWALLGKLSDAQMAAAGSLTLAGLLDESLQA